MMRIPIILLTICQFFSSCNSQSVNSAGDLSYRSGRLYVKDTSLYSPIFLSELRQLSNTFSEDTLKLIDSTIAQSNWKHLLPNHLRLNHKYSLKAETNMQKYSLVVSRISLTEIWFDLKVVEKSMTVLGIKGVAILNPAFFLGQDQIEDDSTGISFGVDDYSYRSPGCNLSITVALIEEGELRVVVEGNRCSVDSNYLFIGNSPILRCKE